MTEAATRRFGLLIAPLCILSLTAGCGESDTDLSSETGENDATSPSEPGAPAENGVAVDEANAASLAPTTACSDDEAIIFQCGVADGKFISVCAAQGDGGKFAQYRYGEEQKPPELSLPAKVSALAPVYARTGYSGGGEAQLIFANGDYKYVVYSRVVRTRFDGEGNEPDFQSGVMVRKGDTQQADLRCTDPAEASIGTSQAGDLVTQDDTAFIYQD